MNALRFSILVCVFALTFASCGGSSNAPEPATSRTDSGQLRLTIPNATTASATARTKQFISPSVVSVGIAINGATPTIADISSTSPDCTTQTTGRSCIIPLTAPFGSDTFVFTEYAAANGSGTTLGTGTAVVTVVQGTPFVVQATLDGIVSIVQLALGALPPAGTAGTTTLIVTAQDPGGNTIIGPGNYTSPIALTVSDPSGQTTLSTASVASPSAAVTVNYAGGYNVNATITATIAGATPASVVFAPPGSQAVYYVTDAGTNSLAAFPLTASGNVAPLRTVSGAATGLGFPRRIVADSAANLYVANASTSPESITVYAPHPTGNVAPLRTIAGTNTFLTGIDGIAVDAQNEVYAADCGSCFLGTGAPAVLVFAAGAAGNVAPIRNIVGAATTLSDPTALSVDTGGNVVVSDFSTNAIDVWPASATGDVAPSSVIAGQLTGISAPEGVNLDSAGAIYVSNSASHTVTVYPAGSTGNVAPVRTIGGSNTGIVYPTTVQFDTTGNMYVTDITNNTIEVFAPNANGNQMPLFVLGGTLTALAGPIGLVISP